MEQQLGVREQAHVVAYGCREEVPHGLEPERVVFQDVELPQDEHSERCCEVLERCEGAWVWKFHDGPFVDD